MSEHLDFAKRFFGAIQAGDIDAVRDMYAPDAEIWHNNDGVIQTREENLVTLRGVVDNLKDLSYDVAALHETSTGFVQQHVLRAVVNGTPVEIPACIIVTLVEGRITRLDEYLDSAHVQRIFDAFTA